MGVDISVWRARIGSFNLSVRRFSGKRAKPTSRATNGLEVALVATIVLLILAGDMDFNQLQQRNMDNRTTVGLKVETTRVSLVLPSSAEKQSSVLHAHFDQLIVQPDLLAVKLYSKGLIIDQAVTLISDIITNGSIEMMGHYPTLQSVGMSIRETLKLYEPPGPVCQLFLIIPTTHHSLSPPVVTSCPLISPATTVPYHSPSHTTTITTELRSFSHTGAAQGLIEIVAMVLFSLLILAGDVELNPGPVVTDVFRKHYAKLVRAITEPSLLAADLFSADLISESVMTKVTTMTNAGNTDRATIIMTELLARINSDPKPVEVMKQLFEVMRQYPALQSVAMSIREALEVSGVVVEDILSSPPMKKRKSQPGDPVTNYAEYLKYQYKQPLPDEEKLLITPSKYYIDLAVISNERVTRQEADEFTRKTLHGLTEEVLQKKTPIALQDMLKPGQDSKPVRCVLIEGAPGVGKSTLAWELCHKWEELECVKAFDLVVLVQLRERSAQEAQKLSDLFPQSRNTNIEEILDSIGYGKGVLLVLDGFDELPYEQQQKESVYIQLIKGRELPEAIVIITSRPSVSADLRNLCQYSIDKCLEILGFAEEQVVEYAKSVFSESETQCTAFLQYINGNPIIKGMMYLPLNAVIVAVIFKDSTSYGTDCRYPKTMTQLFDALTRSLIRRHLVHNRMITNDYCMPHPLQRIEDIIKLGQLKVHPETSMADQFVKLAGMAYDGLLKQT